MARICSGMLVVRARRRRSEKGLATLDIQAVFAGLPKVVLSLSLLHLSACILFILGYGFGFGGNIISLFAPEDIFGVGLKDLAFIYAASIILPVTFKMARLRSKHPYASDKVEAIENSDDRERARAHLSAIRRILLIIVVAFVLLATAMAIYAFIAGNPIGYIFASWPLVLIISISQEKIKEIFNIDYQVAEAIDTLFVLFISALSFGALFGARDRDSRFSDFLEGSLFCQEFAVIRSISDYFIATSDGDEKVIIDSNCEVVFTFGPQRSPSS